MFTCECKQTYICIHMYKEANMTLYFLVTIHWSTEVLRLIFIVFVFDVFSFLNVKFKSNYIDLEVTKIVKPSNLPNYQFAFSFLPHQKINLCHYVNT